MKNWILILLAIVTLNSCSKEDTEIVLIGKWKLIELFYSIGGGTVIYAPIVSEETIEFFNDGTIVFSYQYLCPGDTIANDNIGEYFSAGNYIIIKNCGLNEVRIKYELESSYLILKPPCVEACQEKYIKIE